MFDGPSVIEGSGLGTEVKSPHPEVTVIVMVY